MTNEKQIEFWKDAYDKERADKLRLSVQYENEQTISRNWENSYLTEKGKRVVLESELQLCQDKAKRRERLLTLGEEAYYRGHKVSELWDMMEDARVSVDELGLSVDQLKIELRQTNAKLTTMTNERDHYYERTVANRRLYEDECQERADLQERIEKMQRAWQDLLGDEYDER